MIFLISSSTMMSSDSRGSLYAILSGFLYGFLGYFGLNSINAHLSASNMLFWRFLISSLVILILLILKIRKINDSWSQIFRAFIAGAIYYGLSTLLYFLSSRYIGTGLAMVIFFTYPVLIMMINYCLYRQAIPRIYYLAVLIILSGMALLIDLEQMAFDFWGLFLAISSAFFYAGYIIASKNNKISPNVSTLMVSLGCMLTSFIVAISGNTFEIPSTVFVWLNLFGIGIIATVVPILLMLHSLKYISSEKASILSVLEPVFVVLFGVLLLGEKLNFLNTIGVLFVLMGALMTLLSKNSEQQKDTHQTEALVIS